MSMGLGKQYWVHMIRHHHGDLESCIKYMQEHKPSSNTQWYELRPIPKIKKGQEITCDEYSCDLVEQAK